MPKVAIKTKCPPHYWKINDQDYGVCEYCGEERQFTRRGDIDWGDVLRGAYVIGKAKRAILPYIASEV